MSDIMIYGLDGRQMPVECRVDRCEWRILPEDADRLDAVPMRCASTAIRLSVDPGGCRSTVSDCLCDEHGGTETALARLRRDWDVLAPLSVRDVNGTGTTGLATPEMIVRILRERDEIIADRWDVAIVSDDLPHRPEHIPPTRSFGTEAKAHSWADALIALGLRHAITHRPAGVRARPRPWIAQIGIGSMARHVGAYATREEAIDRGIEAWRANLERRIQEIRAMRGGTLDWGIPVTPREQPMLIESLPGESSWDTYERYGREREE